MMFRPLKTALAAAALATIGLSGQAFAQAAVMKECGSEWSAAKAASTVPAGQTWNQFLADCRIRKASATTTAPAPAATTTTTTTAPAANPLKPAAVKPAAPVAMAAPAVAGAAVYPKAINPTYSTLSPGKARLKTCSEQYQANKTSNGNGGMKWIEKGGGYWSLCNKSLKGEA